MSRRAACHLPERVRHRPKWQLVLDMLDELDQWGLRPPILVADAGYGEVGEFRQGLDDREIGYVVQVKADTSAYPEQVHPTTAPYRGRGRRPRPRYRDKPASLKQLALQAGPQAGVELIWRRGSKACNAPASRPCGSVRLGSSHAARLPPVPPTPGGNCRPVGCWSSGLLTRPSRSSTGCRTSPRPRRWWNWSASASCAGGLSRTTASSRARLAWTISKAAPGRAGTIT
jgi:hypothetical protein